MTEKIITKKNVEYVAKLARVQLTEKEKDVFQDQLERVLEYIEKLKKLNTDNVPATAHPIDVNNVWRDDVAKPFKNIPELLKNAPEKEETYYKVKKVIE